jgi:hypothetical protein
MIEARAKIIPPKIGNSQALTPRQVQVEWLKCYADVRYFTMRYGWLYNATEQAWLPFRLWPAQAMTLRRMADERLLVILKARQLGISWLCLAYTLWLLIYQAPATILLFSLREAEAVELLERLRGMYARLPRWMQARQVLRQSGTVWMLSNGSRALAFSTKGGRSYTGTLALVDEADFVPDLGLFLNGVKPTVDAGGKLFLVSTSDKRRPVSTFKNLFRAALQGVGDYRPLFLSWQSRPGRDAAWHARTKAEMYAQRGTHDDFYAEYPATAEEALAPEQLDRRIPYEWLKEVIEELPPIKGESAPAIPGLTIYLPPQVGRRYVIGVDPAEGNPNSDDSVATVLDATRPTSGVALDATRPTSGVDSESWAEVANLVGKFEPGVLAAFVDRLSGYYNGADALVERNNHGHTVIRALREHGETRVLDGYDGKPGWLSNLKGKPLMYDALAEAVRDGVCKVRSVETASQLASIEAGTLRAPAGLHDDRADSFALAIAALVYGHTRGEASIAVSPIDPLAAIDQERW